jgi:signal transduction histidine kinase
MVAERINPSASTVNIANYDTSQNPKDETAIAPLIADTTHDLCNLVSAFQVRLYLAQKMPSQWSEHLTVLGRLANDLDVLVKKLVTVSVPKPAMPPYRFNLNEIVQRVVEIYRLIAYCKGLNLVVEADLNLPLILANETEIKVVVANIVSNAIKYTPDGGSITLTTAQDANTVQFTTRDTGIGISPEAIPHIFERYYRSSEAQAFEAGMGLGLAIAFGIVKKYGGTIEVESVLGKGSVFRVSLPKVV